MTHDEDIKQAASPSISPTPQSSEPGKRPLTERETAMVSAIEGRRWGDVSAYWITGLGGQQLLKDGRISADDVRAFEDWRRERDGEARARAAGRVA